MSLVDLLSDSIDSNQIQQIASKIGATPEQTENAIGLAIPALLGALTNKAEDPGAMQQMHAHFSATETKPVASLLGCDSLNGLLQALGGNSSNPLGGLLGGRQQKVENGIGNAVGLTAGQVTSLLSLLAPMIIGAVAHKSRSGGMDLGGMIDMLRGEKKQMQQQASGGLLAGLLDQDGDGDFDLKDMISLGLKFFRRK
ncbi:MAG: DUF937 domain-containing protein [Pirellulales bacterium]